SDDPVDQPRRVTSRDEVLKKRRNVDKRGRIPYGVVFVFVVGFIRADGVIPRPLAIVQAFTERERPVVKRCSRRHGTYAVLLFQGECEQRIPRRYRDVLPAA